MKICRICKLEKSINDFGKYSRSKDGLQTRCKECKTKYDNEYYSSHPERKNYIKVANRNRLIKRLDFIANFFNKNLCVDCGESDIRVLEFDHVRGTKIGNVGTLVHDQYSWKQTLKEIEKCEVRCCNCHRKKTLERMGGSWRQLYIT